MTTKQTALVQKYASAFVDVVLENNETQAIYPELSAMMAVFDQTDLEAFLSGVQVPNEEKVRAVRLFQGSGSVHLNNFLEVMVQNERMNLLYPVLKEIDRLLSRKSNAFDLTIRSAVPVTDAQREQLQAIASSKLGVTVRSVVETIDPSLIGGFVLEANQKQIDTSLKRQLQEVKNLIK